jgi:DNA-3-methyladenine glycosylase I
MTYTEPYTSSVYVDADPERVFDYFTKPDAILRWMGDYAVLDPVPGGQFTLDINGVPVRGRYLAVDRPHRLLLSWGHAGSDRLPPGGSTVEVTFAPDDGGTIVTVVHAGLPAADADQHRSGWAHFLDRLVVAAQGGDPGPDPWSDRQPATPPQPAGIVVGEDGLARCWWCGDDPLYRRYHDLEWGRPVDDDRRLFEKLSLEGFQSGLSWLTILRKRENFRKAFRDFDIQAVARFGARSVDRLLADSGIVRNRAKIEATINNARRCLELLEEFDSLAGYVWQFEPDPRTRP